MRQRGRSSRATGSLRSGRWPPNWPSIRTRFSASTSGLTAEGLLERRHGDGTFVADHVPTGQMKAQRQLLRQQIAQVAELAKTLGRRRGRSTSILDEVLE